MARKNRVSVLLVALAMLSAPLALAQPLHLSTSSQQRMSDNGGAIGFLYHEELVVAGTSQIAALGVTDMLTQSSPLRAGDVVIAVNDRTASTAGVLRSYVGSLRPGSNAQVTVMRPGSTEPSKLTVVVVSRHSLRIPGLEQPPSTGTTFRRSCVAGAVGGIITATLTLLIAPIDGGFTFAAFVPKAVIGAGIGCAAVGAGGALAQEAIPSPNVIAYRRIM